MSSEFFNECTGRYIYCNYKGKGRTRVRFLLVSVDITLNLSFGKLNIIKLCQSHKYLLMVSFKLLGHKHRHPIYLRSLLRMNVNGMFPCRLLAR